MRKRIALLTVASWAFLIGGSVAQKGTSKTKIPKMSAAQVLEKSVEMRGGRKAFERITTTVIKGIVEMTNQGLKGTLEIYAKSPNKLLAIQRFEGIGEFKMGYDGKVGWSLDPIQGLRQLEGTELAQLKREATFNADLRWRELYKKVTLVGTRKVGQRNAYVIRLVPTLGKPVTHYYDTKTFLLLRIDSVQEGPQGEIPMESYLTDYRTVDGVKIPFVTRQRLPVGELVVRIQQLQTNVSLPDSFFTKPTVSSTKEKTQ